MARHLLQEGCSASVAKSIAEESTNPWLQDAPSSRGSSAESVEEMLDRFRLRMTESDYERLIDDLVADGVPRGLAESMIAENRGQGTLPKGASAVAAPRNPRALDSPRP